MLLSLCKKPIVKKFHRSSRKSWFKNSCNKHTQNDFKSWYALHLDWCFSHNFFAYAHARRLNSIIKYKKPNFKSISKSWFTNNQSVFCIIIFSFKKLIRIKNTLPSYLAVMLDIRLLFQNISGINHGKIDER